MPVLVNELAEPFAIVGRQLELAVEHVVANHPLERDLKKFKSFYNNESSRTDPNFEKLFTIYLNNFRLSKDKSSPHVL